MTDQDIIEGRDLLFACLAAPRGATAVVDTGDARAQRAAKAELDQWDEPSFGRFGATLKRHHPEANTYVFHELSAATGDAAVHGIATFLTRLDALEGGTDPERSGTKKDDKKAVELLAKRGLDKAERARLRNLVNVALGPTATLPEQPATQTREERPPDAVLRDGQGVHRITVECSCCVHECCERACDPALPCGDGSPGGIGSQRAGFSVTSSSRRQDSTEKREVAARNGSVRGPLLIG